MSCTPGYSKRERALLEEHHIKGKKNSLLELRCDGVLLIQAMLKWIGDHGSLPPGVELLCANCHKRAET
jgi:hypothetical protein